MFRKTCNYEDSIQAAKTMLQRVKTAGQDAKTQGDAHYAVAEACLAAGQQAVGGDEEHLIDCEDAAKKAITHYDEAGSGKETGHCHIIICDLNIERAEYDIATAAASKAEACYSKEGYKTGIASTIHRKGRILKAQGSYVGALRCAEQAQVMWRMLGETRLEVDAAVLDAELKMTIAQERNIEGHMGESNTIIPMQMAKAALSLAQKHRSDDAELLGNANYTYARGLLKLAGYKDASVVIREAKRLFRKSGNPRSLALALTLSAKVDVQLRWTKDGHEDANEAMGIFAELEDEQGKLACFEVGEKLKELRGIPTQAQLEEREKQLALQQQQQQMMMLQQGGNFQMMQWMQMQQQMGAPQQQDEAPAADQPQQPVARTGEKLAVMEEGLVRSKIKDLAMGIIGDEDFEFDTPLMEAGLTSNQAVVLRDQLTEDIPGIKLPPTLIFDYPSASAITEFIMDHANRKKR
jgi:tetratricopeptide (TPR) repeat protein